MNDKSRGMCENVKTTLNWLKVGSIEISVIDNKTFGFHNKNKCLSLHKTVPGIEAGLELLLSLSVLSPEPLR